MNPQSWRTRLGQSMNRGYHRLPNNKACLQIINIGTGIANFWRVQHFWKIPSKQSQESWLVGHSNGCNLVSSCLQPMMGILIDPPVLHPSVGYYPLLLGVVLTSNLLQLLLISLPLNHKLIHPHGQLLPQRSRFTGCPAADHLAGGDGRRHRGKGFRGWCPENLMLQGTTPHDLPGNTSGLM